MKRVSTLFLKAVIVLIGAGVLAICAFTFLNVWYGIQAEWPALPVGLVYPGIIAIYATVIPFLFALVQAFVLLQYIDTNNAFSEASIQALRKITYCAIAISALYAMAMPLMFMVAELDDAPGLVLIWFAIICTPLIVATFASVVQKLVQSALAIKQENDLTV